MKLCTCFMLFGILAYTNSKTRNKTKAYHRSNNPAIENILELIKEEYSRDNKTLDNVLHFIAKETAVTDKNKNKKQVLRSARTETFTGFIQEAVSILNTYEDTAFQDFFRILDTEITKYNYRDCRFSELTQNQDTRSFLAGSLQILRDKSVSFMKANINEMADMMRDETYGNDVKKMLDYINSLYTHTEQKFRRVLNEMKHYRKTKSIKAPKNLIKVIRSGVRDILFDHYTALDSNTRRELKERIEKFWKSFKKNPVSSAEVSDSHERNDTVSNSVTISIEVSKTEIDEDKDPEHYSKNDPQRDLRNERDRKSKEKYYQQPQDIETEKDDSSNEDEKRNTDTDTPDEISSGESFDSSSNSIKQSQERQAKFNTDRYMTLYTEEISYKSRTAKTTEIIPSPANKMIKKATVPRRPTTTSAPYSTEDESDGRKKVYDLRSNYNPDDIKQGISHSDHDTKNVVTVKSNKQFRFGSGSVLRTRGNKQRKLSMPEKSKSSTHDNAHVIGEYNAVIDVQLANTELLKSLGILQPVSDNKYDTISYRKSVLQTKSVSTRPTTLFRSMPAGAETKLMKSGLSKPPSEYSKTQESIYLNRLNNTRRNKLSFLPDEDDFIRKQKQKYLTRQNANGTDLNVPKNFGEYVIKRLDTLEHDFRDFRSMLYDINTHVEVTNVTDKYKAKNKIGDKRKDTKYNVVRLKIENDDLNKENNDRQITRSNIMNTESNTNNTSFNPKVIKKITLNTTAIDNNNTSQVTSKNVNDNKKLNKDKIDDSEPTVAVNSSVKVKDSTEFEPFETTSATTRIRRTTFEDSNVSYQLAHINDGLDLRI